MVLSQMNTGKAGPGRKEVRKQPAMTNDKHHKPCMTLKKGRRRLREATLL